MSRSPFANLATSKKRKDDKAAAREIAEGRALQDAIRAVLASWRARAATGIARRSRPIWIRAAKRAEVTIPAPIKKAIFAALGERDPEAEICRDSKDRPEPDSELRDTENIPLPEGTALPLPMQFGPDKPNDGWSRRSAT